MQVFDSIQVETPSKNVFNLSHDVKASYNFDKIYPFFSQLAYPGETWNIRTEAFMRAMPLLAPVLHNVDLFMWFVAVPCRLVFNADKKHDFRIFVTGGEDGLQEAELPTWDYYTVSQVDRKLVQHGSLIDHMGFPTIDDSNDHSVHSSKVNQRINVLPFRAYQFAYNELFRNQNVQDEIEFSYDQGEISSADVEALFSFRKKCWEKDYFTSCLPWSQRGKAMLLPITAPEYGTETVLAPVSVNSARVGSATTDRGVKVGDSSGFIAVANGGSSDNNQPVTFRGEATINASEVVRFSGLEIGTINDFRYCLRLQQWMEINARSGSRYIEQIFAHFGVRSSDARLQRPELLGGGKIPLIFSDIPQTSYGDGVDRDVLGDLGGKGTLYGKTDGFKAYFEEHTIILGLLSIVPRTSYAQGIPRQWSLLDKTDWYWPKFAHLGEQAVLNKEIYFNPAEYDGADPETGDDGVFGYQGRFTEMRYIPSTYHGEMRDTLLYWHMGRRFNAVPTLNSDFVTAQSEPRCFALADVASGKYDPFIAQLHLDIKAVRPLPKFATPTL